jgi:hypothetical protein
MVYIGLAFQFTCQVGTVKVNSKLTQVFGPYLFDVIWTMGDRISPGRGTSVLFVEPESIVEALGVVRLDFPVCNRAFLA